MSAEKLLCVQEVADLLGLKVGTIHKYTQLSRNHSKGKKFVRDPFPDPVESIVDRPQYSEASVIAWSRRTGRTIA